MKIKNLIALIVLISFFSGKSEKKQIFETPQTVIVAGKVNNPSPKLKQVEIYVNRLVQSQDKIIAELDSTGNFKGVFKTFLPTDFILRYNERIFAIAHPNDSIYIELDGSAKNLKNFTNSIRFSGNRKETNQAISIMNFKYNNYKPNSYENRMNAIKNLKTSDYVLHIDSVYNANQKLYNDFINETNPTDEAKLWAKMHIDQAYFDAINDYPRAHKYANNLKDFDVAFEFYKPLDPKYPINDAMLTNAFTMNHFISCYHSFSIKKVADDFNKTKTDDFKITQEFVDSSFVYGFIKFTKDERLRQLILFKHFYININNKKLDVYENHIDVVNQYITDPFLKQPLTEIYKKVKQELLTPKQKISEDIFQKLEGSKLKLTFDSILSQNRGKVIYIDCWAVWCGPCIANFKSTKKLHRDFGGEAFEFVYLCIESDKKKWEDLVKIHKLDGQHYLLDKKESSELRDAFGIKGVPHHILIDKKGSIYEKDAASPSQISNEIERLINEKI